MSKKKKIPITPQQYEVLKALFRVFRHQDDKCINLAKKTRHRARKQ